MSYLHGVYTSEKSTSVIPGVDAPSAVPFVIGTVADSYFPPANYGKAVRVSSWSEFVVALNYDDPDGMDYDAAIDADGEDSRNTLAAFARQWFLRSGCGEAIVVPVAYTSAAGSEPEKISTADVVKALAALRSSYEQFGVVPGMVVLPYYNESLQDITTACHSFGSGFSCVCFFDIAFDGSATRPPHPVVDSHAILCAPRALVGTEVLPASIAICAAIAVTDAENGGPFNSPSNKQARIDGVVDANADPLFLTREQVNDKFNAEGVLSFWHNDSGWVVWGNNTSAYPGSTDPKDRFIPIRRVFSYIRNDVTRYMSSRIDSPINKRQLDGVVNAYNMRLAGFRGSGMVNSAKIFVDWEKSTAESLLSGAVWFGIAIAPPPPAEQMHFAFEYDVVGFTDSLS